MVALGQRGPEALVKHPVGIWSQGETVAGFVVSRDGVLVDVSSLDNRGCLGIEAVAGERAGEVVAGEDVAFEPGVTAFFLAGFEFNGVGADRLDIRVLWKREPESFAEADLLCGLKVDGHEVLSSFAPKIGVLQAGEEFGIERAKACCSLGVGRLTIGGETFPNLIPVAAECVKWHGDVR